MRPEREDEAADRLAEVADLLALGLLRLKLRRAQQPPESGERGLEVSPPWRPDRDRDEPRSGGPRSGEPRGGGPG